MRKFIDLIGQKFNRLIPMKYVGKDKYGNCIWECLCECNNIINVITRNLKNGNTKSCGCLQKEIVSKISFHHGHCQKGKESKIHHTWNNMLQRCYNPNDKEYKNYGGRNSPITVCDRWNPKKGGSFKNFLEDMGEPPTRKHQIDRIKNDLGYFKENCRWATPKQQSRNRRTNIIVPYKGKDICLKDYCQELNLNYSTIKSRIQNGNYVDFIYKKGEK